MPAKPGSQSSNAGPTARQPFFTDLSDAEWALVRSLLPAGDRQATDLREIGVATLLPAFGLDVKRLALRTTTFGKHRGEHRGGVRTETGTG